MIYPRPLGDAAPFGVPLTTLESINRIAGVLNGCVAFAAAYGVVSLAHDDNG
jgi:hypothetical protein